MIEPKDLLPFKESSDDYEVTEKLKSQFAQAQKERSPFYLTFPEFDEILHWKLRGQYGRQSKRRKVNNSEVIEKITEAAFGITHPDEEYELELKLSILSSLRGVGVPVASAILALVEPDKYGVIDFRVWRRLYNEDKYSFTIPDYKKYLRSIKRIAADLRWSVQEVDLALWEMDRVLG